MTAPIQPVGIRPATPAVLAGTLSGARPASSTTSAGRATPGRPGVALQQLQDSLARLVSNLGGDAADQRLIRLLIGLIILLTLLQGGSDASSSASSGGRSAASSGSAGQADGGLTLFYSSTRITLEQSTTYIQFSDPASMQQLPSPDTPPTGGQRIDLNA